MILYDNDYSQFCRRFDVCMQVNVPKGAYQLPHFYQYWASAHKTSAKCVLRLFYVYLTKIFSNSDYTASNKLMIGERLIRKKLIMKSWWPNLS